MLAIWSLVPLPFLNPAWTSGSFQFTYYWSLAWRIWNENWPFPVLWPLLSFPNSLVYWVQHFTASSFRIWNSSTHLLTYFSPNPWTQEQKALSRANGILCIRKYEVWGWGRELFQASWQYLITWAWECCRNSPSFSVSLPNYAEELSFFFLICQCLELTLLKRNFTSNMTHLLWFIWINKNS